MIQAPDVPYARQPVVTPHATRPVQAASGGRRLPVLSAPAPAVASTITTRACATLRSEDPPEGRRSITTEVDPPLATGWSPLRPTGLFVMSLIATPIMIANEGVALGLVLAVLLVGLSTTLSLKGVSKIEVRSHGISRLGPFGLIQRHVPKDVAILRARRSFLGSSLKVDREDGPIVGPFLTVAMFDTWPEQALRNAGLRFVDPSVGPP